MLYCDAEPMKKVLKAVMKILGAVLLVMGAYLLLLAHPEPLFSYSVTYSNITFSSDSPLSPEIAEIASAVNEIASNSELYDAHIKQRVFVIDKPWLWTFFNGPYRRAMARNFELGNSIFVPQLNVASQQIRHFDGRQADAANLLAHEVVHTLVQKRIGLIALWRLQWWQKEGYPEYIASKTGQSEAPLPYQKAVLVWKCLLDKHHLTFEDVIKLRQPYREVLKKFQCKATAPNMSYRIAVRWCGQHRNVSQNSG